MNKDNNLGPGAVFEMGGENTSFAQYFVGKSYLNMLNYEFQYVCTTKNFI